MEKEKIRIQMSKDFQVVEVTLEVDLATKTADKKIAAAQNKAKALLESTIKMVSDISPTIVKETPKALPANPWHAKEKPKPARKSNWYNNAPKIDISKNKEYLNEPYILKNGIRQGQPAKTKDGKIITRGEFYNSKKSKVPFYEMTKAEIESL